MHTDQEQDAGSPGEPLRSHRTILRLEIRQAEEELRRPAFGLWISGMLAGIAVGLSVLAVAALHSLFGAETPRWMAEIMLANGYSVGFILAILARTDLFTEYTTMAVLPVLERKASWRALARLWGIVYLANLAGGLVLAAAVVVLGPRLGAIAPESFDILARDLLRHPWWVVLLSGSLAGWLMGLLSWLVAAGRDTTSQILFVWVIAFLIGFGHLHHAITGGIEVLAGIFVGQGLGAADFGYFLLWTTLGNAAGGIVFALLIHFSVIRES